MEKAKGKLYIIATPIGNLKDITYRAIETLKEVDIIACEDTRHSRILLNHYGINKPLISYYKHKEKQRASEMITLLNNGKKIALISDAGMPCISDPGSILVQALRKEGIEVTVLPGASALTSAMALSGIEGHFTFLGFLSPQKKQRESILEYFKLAPTALVIYCSPYDLKDTLEFLYKQLGTRRVHVIKEISKIYENIYSDNLGEINIDNPKGEYVIIVEKSENNETIIEDEEIKTLLCNYLTEGLTKKEAIQRICQDYKINKNKVYALSLDI